MKHEHINEIKAIIILAFGIILLASLISFVPEDLPWYTSQPNDPVHNLIKVVGAYSAGVLVFIFGYGAYALPLFLLFWSWNKFTKRAIHFSGSKALSFMVLFCVVSSIFATFSIEKAERFQKGGVVGFILSDFLNQYLGRTGTYVILYSLGAMSLILIGEFLISPLLVKGWANFQAAVNSWAQKMNQSKKMPAKTNLTSKNRESFVPKPIKKIFENENEDKGKDKHNVKILSKEQAVAKKSEASVVPNPLVPQIRIAEHSPEKDVIEKEPEPIGEYNLPSLDLLSDPPKVSSSQLQSDLENGAKILESTLADFNVDVRVVDIERGPVITRYELEPAPGVKVQKITSLADDIALVMKAHTVRIVAPIPGKNRVGIEVPNGSSASVYLKDVLSQSNFRYQGSKLMLALGKDIAGEAMIADLAEMPHLLIAGTTGAGKTVCVNSIIMSILFNAAPDEVKFLMVDPKMVELNQYNDIPHALCPSVTDPQKVSAALNWVVSEMESRYTVLSKAGVRNIKAYHNLGQKMPYIIVIIDELADLMQVSAKTIESAITRLAQLSRAVGIHLILATQRPSVDVITGVIKANFPARISFKVASKVDSRTVLDMNGAENLLGKGDMLFLKPGDAKPIRGQCSFVNDAEIQRVISFIKGQQNPVYDDAILSKQRSSGTAGSEEKDELYDEAVRLVIETNQASVSILQRRMRLGYTRAARLIDMMEQTGIVGPYCGSKPRDILVNREEWLLNNMKKDGQPG